MLFKTQVPGFKTQFSLTKITRKYREWLKKKKKKVLSTIKHTQTEKPDDFPLSTPLNHAHQLKTIMNGNLC